MYFKVSVRTNPATGIYSVYYRLVESFRTGDDRILHRTILNVGYLDEQFSGNDMAIFYNTIPQIEATIRTLQKEKIRSTQI